MKKEAPVLLTKVMLDFDANKLHEALNAYIQKFPFQTSNQISLTGTAEDFSPYDNVGSIEKLAPSLFEDHFKFLHPALKGTYVEEFLRLIPENHGRVRLMRLLPKSCYSIHRDATPRVHFVLETNPNALMIFPDWGSAHLTQHSLFLSDTRYPHTAMNGGETERIHLVCSVIPS